MDQEIVKRLRSTLSQLNGLEKELKARGESPEICIKSLPELNRMMWGLRKGLTVIAARTSQGKSALALQLALDTAKQGFETVVLSLEMDTESMLERLFCNEYEIDNFELTSGRFNSVERYQKAFEEFKVKMQERPLLLTCGIGKTFQECNRFVEMLDPKPRVLILDYIQMSKTTGNDRVDISEYIRQFRQLMIENGMRGIVCSQINRQIEKENDYHPRLENLKGTGALEEVSDVCLLLHWNYFYTRQEHTKNVYDIQIAKNRHGRTGNHKVEYFPEFYKFKEIQLIAPKPADPTNEEEWIK